MVLSSRSGLEAWEPGVPMCKGRRKWKSQLKQREQIYPSLPFCSNQALSGLDDADMHWWGQSSLFSLLIQMLIFSENTFIDTSRNSVLPATGAPLSLVRLTHKINHHRGQNKLLYDVTTVVPIISPYSQISEHNLMPLYKVLNCSPAVNQ